MLHDSDVFLVCLVPPPVRPLHLDSKNQPEAGASDRGGNRMPRRVPDAEIDRGILVRGVRGRAGLLGPGGETADLEI